MVHAGVLPVSCYVDDTLPLDNPPPWLPGTSACRLTADTRAELEEMCRALELPCNRENYQLLTPEKRFAALKFGAVDKGTLSLFGDFDFGDEAAA